MYKIILYIFSFKNIYFAILFRLYVFIFIFLYFENFLFHHAEQPEYIGNQFLIFRIQFMYKIILYVFSFKNTYFPILFIFLIFIFTFGNVLKNIFNINYVQDNSVYTLFQKIRTLQFCSSFMFYFYFYFSIYLRQG